MTPIQEIQMKLGNGDLVDCNIEGESTHFAGNWQLIQADGMRFNLSKTGPFITACLAFEALLTAVASIAGARNTDVRAIDNPSNVELVSRSQQQDQVAKHGLVATVLVNGQ